ncbi:MAG: hypothetical protein HQK53_12770 [Oligoflexia bacterium]|nr:hypothetical protein [Oligoflexia bacterium]
MARMIGKAKQLKREGGTIPFEEIHVEGPSSTIISSPFSCDIEVQEKDKIIRFKRVDTLIEYLKKAA